MDKLKTKKPKVPRTVRKFSHSHRDYVKWANELTNSKLGKIEELSSGDVYCLILNLILPISYITSNKIKLKPIKDLDKIHNLKLLQSALQKMKCDKVCLFSIRLNLNVLTSEVF